MMYVKTDEWSGIVNYTMPTHFTSAEDEQFKFGAGVRRMSFSSDTQNFSFTPAAGIRLSQAVFGGPDIFHNGILKLRSSFLPRPLPPPLPAGPNPPPATP